MKTKTYQIGYQKGLRDSGNKYIWHRVEQDDSQERRDYISGYENGWNDAALISRKIITVAAMPNVES